MLLGVDIGGSAIKMGAVAENGDILARKDRPFDRRERFDDLLGALVDACRDLERRAGEKARAIGVCSPGFVDPARGLLIDGGENVPVLRERPLARLLSARLGAPSIFANDGVAAALGEIRFGAGRHFRRLALLTLGTGVGGCIAFDGNVVTGSAGEPPEIGAMTLSDGGPRIAAGRPGSLESYACAAGFLAAYQDAGGRAAVSDVKELFALAATDEAASGAIDAVARRVAQALGSLINALALDGCVIGGGVAAAGDALIDRIRAHLPDFAWPLLLKAVSVVVATRGNDAGMLGAASLAADALEGISVRKLAER